MKNFIYIKILRCIFRTHYIVQNTLYLSNYLDLILYIIKHMDNPIVLNL
jgi:hypothetical protein